MRPESISHNLDEELEKTSGLGIVLCYHAEPSSFSPAKKLSPAPTLNENVGKNNETGGSAQHLQDEENMNDKDDEVEGVVSDTVVDGDAVPHDPKDLILKDVDPDVSEGQELFDDKLLLVHADHPVPRSGMTAIMYCNLQNDPQ